MPDCRAEPVFSDSRRGRTVLAAGILAAVYAGLAALVATLDAAPWIVAIAVLATLPALRDLVADPRSGLVLTTGALCWHSGKRRDRVPLKDIRRVRFRTRWDFSVAIRLHLRDGRVVRLPPPCTPARHRAFEAALAGLGVATERHHF